MENKKPTESTVGFLFYNPIPSLTFYVINPLLDLQLDNLFSYSFLVFIKQINDQRTFGIT